MVTLEKRIDNALSLRVKGYNCAQCVAMSFNPELEAVTAGLGTGVAATGHICGCCSAMAMVLSEKAYSDPKDKQALYAQIRVLLDKFAAMNQGDTNCSDLRKPGRKPCSELIKDAVTILNEVI
ncbi:MAG: C-GCAxxG-C-C family protein [Bacteroides sp.]|nr:C-GCAxxG-C-C family protein [Bacteroides sp.]MCM1378695.1 C-GCAxxG-C-C family protein [Bacteroides sp.]MCM1444968.1 C-GCAxxG-C-C family protein [Prevotella sp.]